MNSLLINRYEIINPLGSGGFGETFLARDTQMPSQRLVVIKHLKPALQNSHSSTELIKNLFQKEAAILEELGNHCSQIPQLYSSFSEEGEFYLVQEYIEGKNLSQVGQIKPEQATVILSSLLNTLKYVHSKNIIHRDIKPENIILRDSDRLPVLIDFGVVKEFATRLSNSSVHQSTTVGKPGYSPIEQVQTGKAYPNSDLYALAVTAIVLLTGKEPADLFDETTFVWKWQHWVQVSSKFAQVLNRMLSRMPGDRYQTAKEVLLDLTNLEVSSPLNPGDPNLSYLPTLAISHPSPTPTNSPEPVISPHTSSSILDNTLSMIAIGGFVVILTGFSSWSLVNYFRGQRLSPPLSTTPQNFDSPVIPRSTPNSTTPSKMEPRNLTWDSSNSANEEGIIKFGEVIEYSFRGSPGQKLTVAVNEESGVLLTILTADGQPLSTDAQQVTSYERVLTSRGRLTIQLNLSTKVSESSYSLSVALENPIKPAPIPPRTTVPTPLETPIPTPMETPTPTPMETPTPLEDPIPIPTTTAIPTPIPTEEPTIVPTISEDGV